MESKVKQIVYWISTSLLCLMFFAGAMMYLFNYPEVEKAFVSLGFPTWIIYPLAILKILGAITVLTGFSNYLKELAYAGFFYDAIFAMAAHVMVQDGEFAPALVAILLTLTSWVFDRLVFGNYQRKPPTSQANAVTADS